MNGLAFQSAPRLAVVSTAVPPASSGQARVLGQLLGPESGAPVTWFTDQPHLREAGTDHGTCVSLCPARFLLRPDWTAARWHRLNNFGGLGATVFARARQIVAVLREAPVDAVIGASGSPFDIPAAWLAAERLRLPFAAWLFDDPVMQWPADTPYRRFMRFWERGWSRRVLPIAPNEVMAEDFAGRNPKARPALLVRNPASDAAFAPPAPRWPSTREKVRLLYTGSVYGAQADAFRNLLRALEGLPDFKLVLHTAQTPAEVAAQGLDGPALSVRPHLAHAEALAAQQAADILFLPLAFESAIPEVIRSSAPAKAAEYLASGRPVLVHAPSGSFVGRLFGGGAGLVVDRPEPALLAAALRRIRDDATLRDTMAAEAARLAEGFRVGENRARLLGAFTGAT